MSKVIHLKFKGRADPSDATRDAIELELLRLAQRHGCFEVATVALNFVALAIERTLAKGRPNGVGWASDLRARFERAFKR